MARSKLQSCAGHGFPHAMVGSRLRFTRIRLDLWDLRCSILRFTCCAQGERRPARRSQWTANDHTLDYLIGPAPFNNQLKRPGWIHRDWERSRKGGEWWSKGVLESKGISVIRFAWIDRDWLEAGKPRKKCGAINRNLAQLTATRNGFRGLQSDTMATARRARAPRRASICRPGPPDAAPRERRAPSLKCQRTRPRCKQGRRSGFRRAWQRHERPPLCDCGIVNVTCQWRNLRFAIYDFAPIFSTTDEQMPEERGRRIFQPRTLAKHSRKTGKEGNF